MSTHITLRKASQVTNKIVIKLRELKEVPSSVSILLNKEIDPVEQVSHAAEEFITTQDIITKLVRTQYNIRNSVGITNASAGITSLLTENAYISNEISRLVSLRLACKRNVMPSTAVLISEFNMKLAKLETTEDNYYAESLLVNVCSAEFLKSLDARILSLERKNTDISDKILALNLQITIGVSDEDWTLLETLGVV